MIAQTIAPILTTLCLGGIVLIALFLTLMRALAWQHQELDKVEERSNESS